MKQTLTAKLKLKTTPEQFAALRTTQLAYRDTLNFVSRYAFEHGKISSNLRLHKGTYAEAKAARLKRYAELRWISDTSLRDLSGGI